MMVQQPFMPSLDLGTRRTGQDLNDSNLILNLHDPIYLMSLPYSNAQLNSQTIILFLCSLPPNYFNFQLTTSSIRAKDDKQLKCKITIKEEITGKPIFKICFDSCGNSFYIQILGTSTEVKYDLIFLKPNAREIRIYKYKPTFVKIANSKGPFGLAFPEKIFHSLSVLFNKQNAPQNVNDFTASLFYQYSPFNRKTIARKEMNDINPSNEINEIFKKYGGNLFILKGEGPCTCNNEPVVMFCWLNPYFKSVVNHGKSIELDATFRIIYPLAACIPQMVIQNTGVPLGLLIAPSETCNLYSMPFEALKLHESNEDLYEKMLSMNFITDEHKSFIRLKKKYNLNVYNCYTHLIRTIGASSALGLLLKKILFCKTHEEFKEKYTKFVTMYMMIYEITMKKKNVNIKKTENRFLKVGKLLGITPKGVKIDPEFAHAPLFCRVLKEIPTTNNYAEAFHRSLNEIASDRRISMMNRVALVAKKIMERFNNIRNSSESNLKNYIQKLRKQSTISLERKPECKHKLEKNECDCGQAKYYSALYHFQLPCQHCILNPKWTDEFIMNQFEEFSTVFSQLEKDTKELEIKEFDPDAFDQMNEKEEEEDQEEEEDKEDDKNDQEDLSNIIPKKYDDELSNFIYEVYWEMKNICKIDKIETATIIMNVQYEILNDENFKYQIANNKSEYFAILEVKTWLKIYEQKGILSKF